MLNRKEAFAPESSFGRTGRIPPDSRAEMISDLSNNSPLDVSSAVTSRICSPFTSAAIADESSGQVVNIVDQHFELAQKVLSKDTPQVAIGGTWIVELTYEHLLIGDRMGASLKQVELHEGSG